EHTVRAVSIVELVIYFLFVLILCRPTSTLFPYTTLFRSAGGDDRRRQAFRDRGAEGGRLHRRREGARRGAHGAGDRHVRAAALRRQPLRSPAHHAPPPHPAGPQGTRALQA